MRTKVKHFVVDFFRTFKNFASLLSH